MISIFLADDHPLILRGVEELFSGVPDFCVVGREVDADKVVDAVVATLPDVLIQDLAMAGRMAGLEIISAVHVRCPDTRIVVLSMHSVLATICEALHRGARAYVSKSADSQELVDAVRAVRSGRRYIGRPFDEAQVDAVSSDGTKLWTGRRETLTKRELEVLSMVVHGRTSGEIAENLCIGRRTVESHRASLSSKLGVRNQAELVRFAIERGLVTVG